MLLTTFNIYNLIWRLEYCIIISQNGFGFLLWINRLDLWKYHSLLKYVLEGWRCVGFGIEYLNNSRWVLNFFLKENSQNILKLFPISPQLTACFRCLDAGLSPRRHRFDPRPVYGWFVLNKTALWQAFLQVLPSLLSVNSNNIPYSFIYLLVLLYNRIWQCL